MTGTVLNITRYSTNDGPGIRTTVFLKGCPLRCVWCHNPESQKVEREMAFSDNCIKCGTCASVCKTGANTFNGEKHLYSRSLCVDCGACMELCPVGAIDFYGEERSVDSVFDEVVRDRVFYETSNGGVTVSGGEPLLQWKFTAKLFHKLHKESIHTAIETSGFGSREAIEGLIPDTDLFLFDIKETDEEKHIKVTGFSQKQILDNLRIIDYYGKKIILRIPIVPGYQDRKEHFKEVNRIAAGLSNCEGIEIMPYHSLGRRKYHELGRKYACEEIPDPSEETIHYWKRLIQDSKC